MADQMFTLYVFNFLQREINNNQGSWFFNTEKFWGAKAPTVEELKEDIAKGDTTWISKLQYFSQNIRGSDNWWRNKSKELEHWIHHHIGIGNGPPTFFITLSCAEYWWKDLKRLMIELETHAGETNRVENLKKETEDGFKEMTKSIRRWTAHVNDFFMKRANSFMENILKDAMGIEHYWGRVEFAPGRGQIHLHILAISKDKAYLEKYHRAKTEEEKVAAVSEYAEKVLDMTADVDVDDDPEYKADRTKSPLLSKYCQVIDREKDHKGLCQDCMVHHCNDFCLKPTKEQIPRCCKVRAGRETEKGKKDTQGWQLRESHAIITDNRGIKHLELRRTKSRRILQHSKSLLETWRANCDVKILIYESDPNCPDINEIDNVIRYLVAYTVKKNKTHSQEHNIIEDLIKR